MRGRVSTLASWGCAIAVALSVTAAAQVEYTNNFRYNSGQSVQPIFEGWSRLPDGGYNFHFGYLNRNYVERPVVAVGAANSIEPGGPDRGQPTIFYARTNRNLFTVPIPKGWDPKKEVIKGDAEAAKLTTKEYRAPWKLPKV